MSSSRLLLLLAFLALALVSLANARESAGGVLEPMQAPRGSASAKNLGRVFEKASQSVLASLEKVLTSEEYTSGLARVESRLAALKQQGTAMFSSARFAMVEEWKDQVAANHPSMLQATSKAEAQGRTQLFAAIEAALSATAGANAPFYLEIRDAGFPVADDLKMNTYINANVLPLAAQRYGNMNWVKAKQDVDPKVLDNFGKFRAMFIRAISFIVKVTRNPCPNCVIKGSGSDDPASDIDLSSMGWGTNAFIRQWNGQFELHWPGGLTAATVFDVNVYGDCWVWPYSAFSNAIDEAAKGTKVDLLMHPGAGRQVEPLCFARQNIVEDGQTVPVLVYTVPATHAQLDETNQSQWAWVHMVLYRIEEDIHHHVRGCSYGSANLAVDCPSVGRLLANVNMAQNYRADITAAITKITDLVQSPCTVSGTAGCEVVPPGSRSFVKMDDIKKRNDLNFNALDALYTAIDRTVRESLAAHTRDPAAYCLNSKHHMSKAAFYSQEAYLTKGAINHVVHAGQAGLALPWITRAEFFHSFVENWADYQKEVAHEPELPLSATAENVAKAGKKFLIKASKYVARMFDAHRRITKAGHAIPAKDQTFATCAFPHMYTLQKQVRNKPTNSERERTTQCGYNKLLQCFSAYAGSGRELMLTQPLLTAGMNKFGDAVATLFYASYHAGEANNGARALESSFNGKKDYSCWAGDKFPTYVP